MLAVLRILEYSGKFTIVQYNRELENMLFTSYEASDKPYPVPHEKGVKKLKGKAVSIWCHMRNWPIIVKKLMNDLDYDDPILQLGLKLHEICERVTATEFFNYEIDILEVRYVIQYLVSLMLCLVF